MLGRSRRKNRRGRDIGSSDGREGRRRREGGRGEGGGEGGGGRREEG